MKYMKVSLWVLVVLLLTICVIFQVKVENYRTSSAEKYGVYLNAKRQHYTPIAWFYIQVKILHNKDYDLYFKMAHVPYKMVGLREKYLFNAFYSAYLAYAYYDRDTLLNWQSSE